tara:strand:+ start:531 stop:770 length:240 start_codon:yes stop_codon:yes gene_type:complete
MIFNANAIEDALLGKHPIHMYGNRKGTTSPYQAVSEVARCGLLKADDPNYAIDPLLHSGRMCPMCIAATENAHRADTSS